MNRGSILLRVDGSAVDGMGRMARCLALANALQRRRYQMTFLTQIDNIAWPDRIRRHRHGVVKSPHAAGSDLDRANLLRDVEDRRPVVVITDSPGYDEEFLAILSHRVPLVIALDESAAVRFPSDIVLNPTLGATSKDYDLYPGTQVLAGDRYAMVRSEFRRARNVRATEPSGATRVMIALGGGEVAAHTARLAEACLAESKIEKVDCVLGASSEGKNEIRALAEKFPGRVTQVSDARDMANRMTKSHLLITGAGNTPLEAACVGIPMVALAMHEHHEPHGERIEEVGIAQYLGPIRQVAADRVAKAVVEILADNFERKAMSRSGRMLIDGRGADRLVTACEILLRRSRKSKTLPMAA